MIEPGWDRSGDSPAVTKRLLREFAVLLTVLTLGLALWGIGKRGGELTAASLIVLAVAILLGLPGVIYPPWVRPLYRLLMTITRPIGHVVGLALLGVIYFLVLTPLAMVMKLTGRDPLRLRRPRGESLWIKRWTEDDVRHYLRQYQKQVVDPDDGG